MVGSWRGGHGDWRQSPATLSDSLCHREVRILSIYLVHLEPPPLPPPPQKKELRLHDCPEEQIPVCPLTVA